MEAKVREGTPAAGEAAPSPSPPEEGRACSTELVSQSALAEPLESFDCCVCLDLIYKPVVLACGHISCFWCVHQAMSGIMESHCPICRKPYKHFPAVCHLLHNLLWKLKPTDYKRREDEVLESEKEIDCFSTRFIGVASCGDHKKPPPIQDAGRLQIQMKGHPRVVVHMEKYPSLMLFAQGASICSSALRSSTVDTVCLPLSAILEMIFPQEYEARRASVQPMAPSSVLQSEQPVSHTNEDPSQMTMVHYWVGCDYCGMYPIVGKRYKCVDCKEKMGFDLCESCYEGRSFFAARFNQHHTPDHTFVVYDAVYFQHAWPGVRTIQLIGPEPPGSPDAP
ncbi:proteolysis 1 [Wolffia australiana]